MREAWLAVLIASAVSGAGRAEVLAGKVIRQGANGVDETATLTAERDATGVNFRLVNESTTRVTAQFEATLVCGDEGKSPVQRAQPFSITADPGKAGGWGTRFSCWSLMSKVVNLTVSAVEWDIAPLPKPERAESAGEEERRNDPGSAQQARGSTQSGAEEGSGDDARQGRSGAAGTRTEPDSARTRSDGLEEGASEAPPSKRPGEPSRANTSDGQRARGQQPSPSTQPSRARPPSNSSPRASSGLPLPTRLPVSSGSSGSSSSSGSGKAVGGGVLAGGAAAGVVGAAAGAAPAKKPSESELRYQAQRDEVSKGRNHWVPPVASLGVLAAGIGLYLILDGLNSLLSGSDPSPSDAEPPTRFGTLPVLFGVDGPAGWWARPSFQFLVGVESLSYQGHYLDAAARSGASPGLSVSGALTGHMTGGVARWGLLRASAFLVGAYGKLLEPLDSQLEVLHPQENSSQSFLVPRSEVFLGADWSVGLQIWQGLLSPYVEYRNVSLQPVQRLGTMQDGGRATNSSYQEGVLTLTPAGALVLGNTFDFSGLFATSGPLRRSLVIDVSVALTQAAPLNPVLRVGLGYTVTWY